MPGQLWLKNAIDEVCGRSLMCFNRNLSVVYAKAALLWLHIFTSITLTYFQVRYIQISKNMFSCNDCECFFHWQYSCSFQSFRLQSDVCLAKSIVISGEEIKIPNICINDVFEEKNPKRIIFKLAGHQSF